MANQDEGSEISGDWKFKLVKPISSQSRFRENTHKTSKERESTGIDINVRISTRDDWGRSRCTIQIYMYV